MVMVQWLAPSNDGAASILPVATPVTVSPVPSQFGKEGHLHSPMVSGLEDRPFACEPALPDKMAEWQKHSESI
jgi:hypothetical protein